MKKLFTFSALLFAVVLMSSGVAFGWGAAGSDGSNYQALQETAVFFNNSGGTLSAGDVVIIDPSGPGVATGTTLGAYVSTYQARSVAGTTAADNLLAIGVVKSTSVADQRPVAVVTKGPALTTCADSGDAVTQFAAVGTSGGTETADQCGGGTNLGIALEAGDGTDGDSLIIWVDPTGAD